MDSKKWAFDEKLFRNLLEHSTDIIGICGTDGTIQYVSPAVTRIAGYTEKDLVERNFSEFVHPEDLPSVLKSFQDAQAREGAPMGVTCRYRHKNGAWYWADCIWSSYLSDPTIAAVVANVRDVTDKRFIDEELTRSRRELRALAQRVLSVREQEAKRLSIEIHDQMGQALTALKLELVSLEQAFQKKSGMNVIANLDERLRKMNECIDEAMSTARRVSMNLRPRALDQLGLVAALEEEARTFTDRTSILCKLSLPENEPTMDPEKLTAVFRIFQEALTNVARHSNASEVSVELEFTEGNLRLTVADNGTGLVLRKGIVQGFGLIGMKERALAAGLRVDITGTGDGTRVVLEGPRAIDTETKSFDLESLSAREFEVFRMTIAGKRGTEIASHLAINPKTVSTYKTRLFKKLGVQSTAELAQCATRSGVAE